MVVEVSGPMGPLTSKASLNSLGSLFVLIDAHQRVLFAGGVRNSKSISVCDGLESGFHQRPVFSLAER